LGAYPAKYYSKKTFVEKVTISYFDCRSGGGRKTAKTIVAWVDDVDLKKHEVNFLGNMCETRPELKNILPGDHIVFKVKEGIFGRFYEELGMSKVKQISSYQFKLKEPIEISSSINLGLSNIAEFSNQWLQQDNLENDISSRLTNKNEQKTLDLVQIHTVLQSIHVDQLIFKVLSKKLDEVNRSKHISYLDGNVLLSLKVKNYGVYMNSNGKINLFLELWVSAEQNGKLIWGDRMFSYTIDCDSHFMLHRDKDYILMQVNHLVVDVVNQIVIAIQA
jgi:hypothetical protein